MRKYSVVVLSILTLSSVSLFFSSCKEEEEPVKPKLSFASAEMTVNEADGIIEVEVILDKAASADVTVEYELDGDAYDDVRAEQEEVLSDYGVIGDYGEVVIEKGETSAIIELQLYADFIIEADESIEIKITSVGNAKIEITRDDETEITVEQEQDGVLVVLEWDETYDDVDMDILLRIADIGENVATKGVVWGSIQESTVSGESVFIPASIEDVVYGLSYTYYSGTEEPMNFTVTMVDAVDGVFEAEEDREVYPGTYTLANINAWTTVSSTKVVQTFENVAGAFTNFSAITPAVSGSREGSSVVSPFTLKKQANPIESLKHQGFLKGLKKN